MNVLLIALQSGEGLINQMLRDLQQQKKDDGSTKPDTLRSKKVVCAPSRPLPLGAVLVLIFVIWWLPVALSDMMFGFEPAAKPAASQLVVTAEWLLVPEKTTVVTEDQDQLKEQNQLTVVGRDAESPRAPVASEQVVKKGPPPVNAQPVQTPQVAKAPVINQAVVKLTSATDKPSKPTAPGKAVAAVLKRLHPDALPGVILSSSRILPATQKVAMRTASRAITPYGMAEEAFLDSKWALEQRRSSLAVWFLQHALELYPGHLPARELLIEILDKDGKAGEVMFLLAEGLEIAPDYIVFKKNYARLLVDQGDYDAAAKVMLHDGLPAVEEDPEAHVVLAHLYQRLDEPFLAAQTYRNLLVAWPQTGAFWVGLGGALEGQNLPEEAAECYQKALKTKNLRQDLSRYAKKRLSLIAR